MAGAVPSAQNLRLLVRAPRQELVTRQSLVEADARLGGAQGRSSVS